ncbi:MAG: M18 family aminopeptidase [Bacteroidaceae bacterium]|nr:M18 family aminopeptidase [Bacteroidaceae bacterium]
MRYTQELIDFLNASPVNFLAVEEVKKQLAGAGFRYVSLADEWQGLKAGDMVMTSKNDSSVYAVRIGRKPMAEVGFKLICAHCDSPTFRIKPQAEMAGEGNVIRLNVEVYGGPIMSTWFDRPLSLAGRVMMRGESPLAPVTRLLHIKKPLIVIPNLAIHFNRQVNDGVKLSKQKDMLPLMEVSALIEEGLGRDEMLLHVIARELKVKVEDIIDFDLYLYDTTPACTVGLDDELVSAGRLDDLSMVHAGLTALMEAEVSDQTQVLAIFDNEETGSMTKQGAQSPVLRNILLRIAGDELALVRAVENSFMVSADNAHAFHPNYAEKYDPTNHPVMGGGPVVKINAAQKYATDARSSAIFKEICRKAGVPCQTFVNHSDVAGGSTLGNILTSSLPLSGVDMGNPIWAMHSVRETASALDHKYCIQAFRAFYNL